ncbi:MAG: hypothetical protein HZB30_11975 [Nitrospirae bacterium]|nr:hypothetical protein [Nitrospirota bacterium]
MDRLDKISGLAIVLLIITAVVLISSHMGEAGPDSIVHERKALAERPAVNGEMAEELKLIRTLIEANTLDRAEALTRELMQKYPHEGEPHMMMGDISMRRQEPLKAMPEYRQAVDLNPDYLDKKTTLFQGKKLKVAVKEALTEIEKAIRLNPDDASMNSGRKNVYYLQRKIAGSCS